MTKALGVMDDLDQTTDEVLLSRYRDEGLTADFDVLVHRYERELYRYLVRYTGDAALAEDVFQNTFLQVHLKRGLYEDGRPVRPWLYSIATKPSTPSARPGATPRSAWTFGVPPAGEIPTRPLWSTSSSEPMPDRWPNFKARSEKSGCGSRSSDSRTPSSKP